mgnify:CR=1 FL=1
MLKTVRNIRKLYNAKLLFISDDESVKDVIGNEFDDYFKELKIVDNMADSLSFISLGFISFYNSTFKYNKNPS